MSILQKYSFLSTIVINILAIFGFYHYSYYTLATFLIAIFPFVIAEYLNCGFIYESQPIEQYDPPTTLRVSRSVYNELGPDVLQLLLSNRDFNHRGDYERLLQLDAFNIKKREGMIRQEIQQLPTLTLTNHMLERTDQPSCVICRSDFVQNDQVRMMPCFHYFHPTCIDPWLMNKAQCPSCKLSARTA